MYSDGSFTTYSGWFIRDLRHWSIYSLYFEMEHLMHVVYKRVSRITLVSI